MRQTNVFIKSLGGKKDVTNLIYIYRVRHDAVLMVWPVLCGLYTV